jgi:hypothetical protein
MTTRTTIASAVSRYLRLSEEADDCADEVIMALERAGLVVAPRRIPDWMAGAVGFANPKPPLWTDQADEDTTHGA